MTAQTLPADPASSATGVRRVPLPALAPPFDDEQPARSPWISGGGPGGVALPLPFPTPSPAVPRLRLAPSPEPGAAGIATPPAAWSARFVRVLLEALAGLRPLSQLGAWANAEVCRGLSRRVAAADRCRDLRRNTGSVRSLHVSTPAAGVAEVCAVVQIGNRIRAVAMRVEAADSSWRCTALTIG